MATKTNRIQWRRRKHIRLPFPDYRTQGAWYFVTVCCKDKEPHFQEGKVRTLVANILRETAQSHHVEVAVYTVLPNHVHLICSAGEDGVIGFVRRLKGRATAEIRQRFGKRQIGQPSFFDHKLRSEESLRQKCLYVWLNPVRRGLARSIEDYPWSGRVLAV